MGFLISALNPHALPHPQKTVIGRPGQRQASLQEWPLIIGPQRSIDFLRTANPNESLQKGPAMYCPKPDQPYELHTNIATELSIPIALLPETGKEVLRPLCKGTEGG